jgi:predicted RNA-binding Zn-ribbon protein involved in translation (DUF1610 family)
MQIIKCKKCGVEVKPERQTVEYVLKQENGVEVFVISRRTYMFECPNCGAQKQEELQSVE